MAKFFKSGSQNAKVLALLKSKDWVCTSEIYGMFIADPRRRLCDLKDAGHDLEGKRCTLHNYHKGPTKMWHLKIKIPRYRYEQTPTGMREIQLF